MPKTAITRADIMALEDYLPIRKDRRREMAVVKKARRMEVGPFCTFYFESYETMLHQVHEMLAIEKGGEAQIPDELEAYNPLVPQGKELIATVMFEIDDEVRRHKFLSGLGGVWRLARCLEWIPGGWRDAVYDALAARRHRWFGKADACVLMRPEWRDRFL